MRENLLSIPYLLPEYILVFTIIAVLAADLWNKWKSPEEKNITSFWLSMVGMVAASAAVIFYWASPAKNLFGGLLVVDPFSCFFKLLFYVTTIITILICYRSHEVLFQNKGIGEFYAIIIACTLGMSFLAGSHNLLMVYLALEFMSLASYMLTGFVSSSRRSSEAALKYLIYGAVASGVMIYGMSFFYGIFGTFDFAEIANSLHGKFVSSSIALPLVVSTLFILVGFGYKIAAVPFHMWTPDVYEGAPIPIAAYLSVASKAAGFSVLIRFLITVLAPITGDWTAGLTSAATVHWPFIIAVISAVTMTLGNLAAITQDNIKRLLAYSSIAHAGYLLMGVAVLNKLGIEAVLFYFVIYLLMNLGAFLVVQVIYNRNQKEGMVDFERLGWKGPYGAFVAVMMTIFLFSLAGLPPTGGFIGKFYIFAAVIQAKLYWLAIVGILNTVVSLYYYARIVKVMFFAMPKEKDQPEESVHGSRLYATVLLVLVFFIVLFGVYWAPLFDFAEASIRLISG